MLDIVGRVQSSSQYVGYTFKWFKELFGYLKYSRALC